MKKSLISILAISAGVLFGGENLLKNGNIENVKDGKPLHWTKAGKTQADVVNENGNYRLHLKKVKDGSSFCSWSQRVNVTPNTKYKLSGEMEGIGTLYVSEWGANNKWLRQFPGVKFLKKTEKKKVSYEFKTSPDLKFCHVSFQIYGKKREAEGFADNIALELVSEKSE